MWLEARAHAVARWTTLKSQTGPTTSPAHPPPFPTFRGALIRWQSVSFMLALHSRGEAERVQSCRPLGPSAQAYCTTPTPAHLVDRDEGVKQSWVGRLRCWSQEGVERAWEGSQGVGKKKQRQETNRRALLRCEYGRRIVRRRFAQIFHWSYVS